MAITRDVTGPVVQINTGVLSITIDITTATTGAWVYAWIPISTGLTTQTGIPSAAGWTTVASATTAAGTSGETGAILRRQKQAGDTTFTVSWPTTAGKGVMLWQSYNGLDGTTPDEGAAVAVNDSTSRSAVPSPTATPSGAGRWAVTFYGQRSTSSLSKPLTWTKDPSLTDAVQGNNSPAASSPWLSGDIEDSSGTVTQTAQSYTATSNQTQSHDVAGILFLVPQAVAPFSPPARAPRGQAARRGTSSSSRGAPVTGGAPVTPAPFSPPARAPRGQAARRGTSSSSRGAPIVPTPAPFHPPASSSRPGATSRRGRSSSSRGAPIVPTPAPFHPPASSSRPGATSRRGRSSSSRGAPVTAPQTPKVLLISLASAAGTDDYGTAYPQGILATAGVIEGPEFIGADFIINTSGYFTYSGTPGAGNLTGSDAATAGADSFGNNYVSGKASYQSSLATAVDAGTFTTYTGSLFGGWTPKAVIETNAFGDLVLLAAGGRQVLTNNNILDGGGGGATFQADVSVNGVNLNVGNGSNAKINLNPQMATPPNFPTAGTTLAQTQACLDAFIQSFRNRGMVN